MFFAAHGLKTMFFNHDQSDAFLLGIATLFDLGGTRFLPEVKLGSVESDWKALRQDAGQVHGDFNGVLASELERLQRELDGGRS